MASVRVMRLVLGAFVPLTVCCIAIIPPVVLWSHLPDPLASHFGFSGTSNGSMARSSAFAVTWALAVVPSLCVTAAVLRSRRPDRAGGLVALGVLVGAAGAAASIDLLVANLNAHRWSDAHNPAFGLALVLGGPLLLASLVYAVARLLARSAGSPGREHRDPEPGPATTS